MELPAASGGLVLILDKKRSEFARPFHGTPNIGYDWLVKVMKFALVVFIIALLGGGASGCATTASKDRGRAYLQFEIEPTTARVYIDEEYSGELYRWVEGVVPVEPGLRKVTVAAEGYITQRFDIELSKNELVTLELALEKTLELPPEEEETLTVQERARRKRLRREVER